MPSLAFLLLGIAAGFLAADVVSGLVHWVCDTYFRRSTRIIGATLIAPFREHHVDPDAMGAHGWLERSGSTCLAALPLLALAPLALSGPPHAWRPGLAAFVAVLGITLCITNEIHAWAHATSVPPVVRCLQRCGVLLARERHARHHAGAVRGSYAIVSGWSNPWLDAVLPPTEAMLARLGVRTAEEAVAR